MKIIERGPVRAEAIAEELSKTIVLVGDCTDANLLREEAVESTDVYCVLTNDDEANILSALQAKRMGAKKVIAIINRPSYIDLMESGTIDIAVSPQQITIGSLLAPPLSECTRTMLPRRMWASREPMVICCGETAISIVPDSIKSI